MNVWVVGTSPLNIHFPLLLWTFLCCDNSIKLAYLTSHITLIFQSDTKWNYTLHIFKLFISCFPILLFRKIFHVWNQKKQHVTLHTIGEKNVSHSFLSMFPHFSPFPVSSFKFHIFPIFVNCVDCGLIFSWKSFHKTGNHCQETSFLMIRFVFHLVWFLGKIQEKFNGETRNWKLKTRNNLEWIWLLHFTQKLLTVKNWLWNIKKRVLSKTFSWKIIQ